MLEYIVVCNHLSKISEEKTRARAQEHNPSLFPMLVILVFARCANGITLVSFSFLLFLLILSLCATLLVPLRSPHTPFTTPISYFAFHVHHVAVDVVLFSFVTFVPFHIQSLYFMFGLLIQSLDALCSKLLSFDVFVMRFFGCLCFLSNSFNLSNASASTNGLHFYAEEQMRKMVEIKTTFRTWWQNLYLFLVAKSVEPSCEQFHIGNKYAWRNHRAVTFHLNSFFSLRPSFFKQQKFQP